MSQNDNVEILSAEEVEASKQRVEEEFYVDEDAKKIREFVEQIKKADNMGINSFGAAELSQYDKSKNNEIVRSGKNDPQELINIMTNIRDTCSKDLRIKEPNFIEKIFGYGHKQIEKFVGNFSSISEHLDILAQTAEEKLVDLDIARDGMIEFIKDQKEKYNLTELLIEAFEIALAETREESLKNPNNKRTLDAILNSTDLGYRAELMDIRLNKLRINLESSKQAAVMGGQLLFGIEKSKLVLSNFDEMISKWTDGIYLNLISHKINHTLEIADSMSKGTSEVWVQVTNSIVENNKKARILGTTGTINIEALKKAADTLAKDMNENIKGLDESSKIREQTRYALEQMASDHRDRSKKLEAMQLGITNKMVGNVRDRKRIN